MSVRILTRPYGDPAFGALNDALTDAQGGEALRRVTVIAPRGAVALAVRRRLAARRGGVLGVHFVTLTRLAAELAPAWLASTDRLPVTPAVVHEAARAALAGIDDGCLAPVREQPATIRALVRTYAELRGASPAALGSLAARGGLAAETVNILRAMTDRLGAWFDEVDLLGAASAEVQERGAVDTGPIVLYLPDRLGPCHVGLLGLLATLVPLTAVIGITGDGVADGPARDLASRLGGELGESAAPPVRGTGVLVAPTADAEILLAVRHLMGRNASGTRLERMAITYAGNGAYPRLVHDTLLQAGIPFNGSGVRPLAATVAGRTLLGALALGDHDWRRDDVVGWLTSSPIVDGRGRPVPAHAWDVLSCRAGVVAGPAEWSERLDSYAARLRDRAGAPSVGPGVRAPLDADRCDALAAFVTELGGRIASAPSTWARWAEWADRLLRDLLGGDARREGWPPEEIAAFDAVREALRTLSSLRALGHGSPGPAHIRSALAAELEAPAPQTTRSGHGIQVGRVSEIVGLDLDVVCVVGMVEGFPGGTDDDVLVPDAAREACGLPLRGQRAADSRRAYLAALAAASERVLSYPSGDQRRGRELRPSRLLLDTLGALAGATAPLYTRDLPGLGPATGFATVPSFAEAVARDGEPISPDDWDLRSLLRWVEGGEHPARHFLTAMDPVLADGYDLHSGRRARTFSRYDGRVDGVGVPTPAGGTVLSPTGLETFARCPRRYLFGELLGAEVREPPEAVLRIDPPERGLIVHRVLERFVGEELARLPERRIAPSTPWGAEGRARMERIAAEVFADVEARGLTGRPALWQIDRETILGELRHFLREDDRYRSETGAVPEAVEQRFGWDGADPVEVDLEGGRRVRFRGTVDRVDRTPGGGLSVLDYKTGTRGAIEGDPVARGTRLQLPVYGLASRQRYRSEGPVSVGYWYVSDKAGRRGRYEREVLTLDPGIEARFVEVVGTLVSAIEDGMFPGNPSGCAYCPFDDVCPPDRARAWKRKVDDPWAARYKAVTGAEE